MNRHVAQEAGKPVEIAPPRGASKVTLARDHILETIRRGTYRTGQRIPTESNLVQTIGVSRNTIREAVMTLVDSGILERRQGAGTYLLRTDIPGPDSNRQLNKIKTLRLGFVCPQISSFHPLSSYLSGMIRGMTQTGAGEPQIEVRFLTAEPEYRGVGGLHFIDALATGQTVDALVLSAFEISRQDVDAMVRAEVPNVFTGIESPDSRIPFVRSDLARGVEKLIMHFINTGRREVGLILGEPLGRTSAAFLSGAVAALSKRGLPTNLSQRTACLGGDESRLAVAVDQLLNAGVNAIACRDDDFAIRVIQELAKRKLRVPTDVVVAGANDTAVADKQVHLPLTTLRVPLFEMGRAVRESIFDQVTGRRRAGQVIAFEPDLIVRDSAPSLEMQQAQRPSA